MKLLKEISEKSLGVDAAGDVLGESFKVRKSARGILFNDKGEVSLQFVSKFNYYKLPGGEVEKSETIEDAMRREIMEEVGCDIEMGEPVGITIEYR
ncbi:MAG: NUDIX domain-containing protein, partial [Candidatus Pacebacteria bacterium]|nr:NUDIX domain-containing protein [Candidatus Paceibacterota bacterium]